MQCVYQQILLAFSTKVLFGASYEMSALGAISLSKRGAIPLSKIISSIHVLMRNTRKHVLLVLSRWFVHTKRKSQALHGPRKI